MAKIYILYICYVLSIINCCNSAPSPDVSFVVGPTGAPNNKEGGGENSNGDSTIPQIYKMQIRTTVNNRFAHTTITSKVKNPLDSAQEATFSVILPEKAFISQFIMEVEGKNYTALIKEKEEAKRDYDRAVSSGWGAGHVAVSARDSNRFTVSVNVEASSKAAFYLSYEELLVRKDSRYELILNIHPGQPVEDLNVEVLISESRKIVDVRAPPLRSGNEIKEENVDLDPRAVIETINETAVVVRFSPNVERQKQLAHIMKTEEDNGLAAQFVVQYDVERDPQGGEVLVQDGYFVHFFAPSDLEPLPKHVVFVLDTSGSMMGTRLRQLKSAMSSILEQLHEKDIFNLVEFNFNAKVWNLDDNSKSVWYPENSSSFYHMSRETRSFEMFEFPQAYPANSDNIRKAKNSVSEFEADGGTDILTALKVGVHLVNLAKERKIDDIERQPLIIFLTDGEPTVRVTSQTAITNAVTDLNGNSGKSPIFTLSFGNDADRKFLEKLSLKNFGFTRHIYEAADASLQLQDFYNQISSPLLSNVTFNYESTAGTVSNLTDIHFPVVYRGSEVVVCGFANSLSIPDVKGLSSKGQIVLRPTVSHSVTNIERLWAYVSVKQLLAKKEASIGDVDELQKKALELSLKYSFVTPVSSLVVIKPNDTHAVETEDASNVNVHGPPRNSFYRHSSSNAGAPGLAGIAPQSVPYASIGHSSQTSGYYGGASWGSGIQTASIQYQSIPWHRPPTFGGGGYIGRPAPPGMYDSRVANGNIIQNKITNRIIGDDDTFSNNVLVLTYSWIRRIIHADDTISIGSETYKLGTNATILDNPACSKTPSNGPGFCTLLKSCLDISQHLTTKDIYVDNYFCVLQNEYAGVCCPHRAT